MKRMCMVSLIALFLALLSGGPAAIAQNQDSLIKDNLKKLNSLPTVQGREDTKCYKILFDAYLELIKTKPPLEVGPSFNLTTIHAKMPQWGAVSGWAESNSKMAQAILKCKDRKLTMVGLPYGRDNVSPAYAKANLVADVGARGSLRNVEFPYLTALDTIAAFATVETYRLLEADKAQPALDLSIALCFVLRQFCDREFLAEKLHAIEMLSDALSNLRDVFYTYQSKITDEQYRQLSMLEIPYLRPDRNRLFMPEADRIVAEDLINEVFEDKGDQADPEKFTAAFAEIQSKNAPLTRFGAARRWRMIAGIHGSRTASLDKLKLIYDDWFRRWRIDAYDPILTVPTEFKRTNEIRYAAVLYSIQDVETLFEIRNQLIAEVNGTALASRICGYKKRYQKYPKTVEDAVQFLRKLSDADPYDKELRPFKYYVVDAVRTVNIPAGRLDIPKDEALLYSQGQDRQDSLAKQHTDDGAMGDLMLWPPVKALARQQGLAD